jgi:dihydrofolate reductase
MRKLTATLFITLDGIVGGEEEMSVWHFPYFSDELGAAAGGAYDPADTILLGRVTYDSFAGAWPEREKAGGDDAEFAAQLGDERKVVVSRAPLTFEWRNSEQLEGDLIEAVTALKNPRDGANRRPRFDLGRRRAPRRGNRRRVAPNGPPGRDADGPEALRRR